MATSTSQTIARQAHGASWLRLGPISSCGFRAYRGRICGCRSCDRCRPRSCEGPQAANGPGFRLEASRSNGHRATRDNRCACPADFLRLKDPIGPGRRRGSPFRKSAALHKYHAPAPVVPVPLNASTVHRGQLAIPAAWRSPAESAELTVHVALGGRFRLSASVNQSAAGGLTG